MKTKLIIVYSNLKLFSEKVIKLFSNVRYLFVNYSDQLFFIFEKT